MKVYSEPAFPCIITDSEGKIVNSAVGMTLRDYFAVKAMQSFIDDVQIFKYNGKRISKKAYEIADLMLKEREK